MNQSHFIYMSFQTDKGKVYSLRLTGADPEATDADIKQTMQDVIASGAVSHVNGSPVSAISADKVTIETQIIDVM